MDTQTIKTILAYTYSRSGYAYFHEFRTMTGYGPIRIIDGVAVGLYKGNAGIKTFEIKVSRSDFLSDVSKFTEKHEDALNIGTEFYYVCPWGLIEKAEVPDIAGLIYVNNNNGIKTQKRATLRLKKKMLFVYFQAFAKEFGNKIEFKTPIIFLGKEITETDLEKEIQGRMDRAIDRQVENMVDLKTQELAEFKSENDKLFVSLRDVCCTSDRTKIRQFCEVGMRVANEYRIFRTVNELKEKLIELVGLLESIKENKAP